jgi:carbon storage regulator
MFIISRRVNQGLVIGQNLRVRIIGVKRNFVRLGVEAPRNVAVHRAEIVARIAADGQLRN